MAVRCVPRAGGLYFAGNRVILHVYHIYRGGLSVGYNLFRSLAFWPYIGKGHDILNKCGILREYSQFVEAVRSHMGEGDALKSAIEECIHAGILREYLKRKGSEVTNMLTAEYNYEEDIAIKQQEALLTGREEGREEGKRDGRLEMLFELVCGNLLTVEAAAHQANLPDEVFREKMGAYKASK